MQIEYEIKLNETGRPYIDLSKDYENMPENNFFVLEMTRYLLVSIHSNRSKELDVESNKMLETTINFLGQISDEVAELIFHQMKNLGDLNKLINKNYQIMVKTIKERDNLDENIAYEGKVYKKEDGLKVLVTKKMKIYEMKNKKWIEL